MSLSQTPFIMSPILSESTPSEYLASTGTTGKCNELPLFFVAINVPTIKMPVCFTNIQKVEYHNRDIHQIKEGKKAVES